MNNTFLIEKSISILIESQIIPYRNEQYTRFDFEQKTSNKNSIF